MPGSALELYNDSTFRQKAEDLAERIVALSDGKERAKAETLLKAYMHNIRNVS